MVTVMGKREKDDGSDLDPLAIHYRFELESGKVREFDVRLDEFSLALMQKERSSYPDWTRLDYNQCPDCALDPRDHPRCPAACAVSHIIEEFRDTSSVEVAEIKITTATRTFEKRAPASVGVSALIGLHMATSGCPILAKLRPMTRTHLPFATTEETMYRVLSMYMLAQYFQMAHGKEPDWDMSGLRELLEDVRQVNKAFCNRIKEPGSQDANLNAVVLLDCFAGITELALKKENLTLIERTFRAYLS
ncbi:DUF6901 family protein [Elusimicrobiota bacterium]